jgi:hypothetical protein
VDHILSQCIFAWEALFGCLQQADLHIATPHPNSGFMVWWLEARDRVHHTNRRKFHMLMVLTSSMLWKQRNAGFSRMRGSSVMLCS